MAASVPAGALVRMAARELKSTVEGIVRPLYQGTSRKLVIPTPVPDNPGRFATAPRMTFVVIGINHRTAPVDIREKVVFAGAELPEALRELVAVPGVRESVIVSTCNRTELYCFTDTPIVGVSATRPQIADPAVTGLPIAGPSAQALV